MGLIAQADEYLKEYMHGVVGEPIPTVDREYFLVAGLRAGLLACVATSNTRQDALILAEREVDECEQSMLRQTEAFDAENSRLEDALAVVTRERDEARLAASDLLAAIGVVKDELAIERAELEKYCSFDPRRI